MVEELTKQQHKPLNLGSDPDSLGYLNPEEKQWMIQQLEEFVLNSTPVPD